MATEPTLGGRILWAATNWEAIRAEDGVMAGRAEYDELRALCARADAAERLAVATDAFDAFCAGQNTRDANAALRAMHGALGPVNEALAAWRAITEVGG